MTIDFRQTSTTVFSDVVLPAATWYEKHDLNTTDMHPFVHSFNPAIAPPWQTRTDWDAWQTIAGKFSELAATHLGVRRDVVAVPLTHDTADAMANPHGVVRDWKKGECEPIPGVTMPKLVEVERDYGAVAEKMNALGPLMETLGATTKGVTFELAAQVDYLRAKNGAVRGGVADGRPSLKTRRQRLRGDPGTVRDHQRAPRDPGLQDPREAHRSPAGRPGRGARGQADHLRRHPGSAGAGDHLTGVVGLRDGRSALLAVHHQRGAQEAVAHADRADALLPRPRLDDRARRGPAGLPAAAEHGGAVRRARPRQRLRRLGRSGRGTDGAVPDPAQQVVDPLGVPGQPLHALALARRPEHLDERPGRRARSASRTTTGSRRSTATVSWSPGRSSRTACPRGRCTCTTPRTG